MDSKADVTFLNLANSVEILSVMTCDVRKNCITIYGRSYCYGSALKELPNIAPRYNTTLSHQNSPTAPNPQKSTLWSELPQTIKAE
jgi:hypothetical protein